MRHIAQQLPAWEEATVKSESDVTRDAKKIQTGTLCNTDGFMSSQKIQSWRRYYADNTEDELCSVNYAVFCVRYDSSKGVRQCQDCSDAQKKRATL